MVEGNYFYNNGVPGSDGEHNSYCEVNGITYQYNDYGPLRAGSAGAELKDRSAGAVIRYNYFTPAATSSTSSTPRIRPPWSPSHHTQTRMCTATYSTTPARTSRLSSFTSAATAGTPGHRPNLYFYDNTVVNVANQSALWRTIMFDLDTSGPDRVCRQQYLLQCACHRRQQPVDLRVLRQAWQHQLLADQLGQPRLARKLISRVGIVVQRHDHRNEHLLRRPEQ